MSETPDATHSSRDSSETPCPPSDEEAAEQSKVEAKEAFDALIRLGGRPTGPIRSNPRWKIVYVDGERCYQDAEEDETIFYSCWYGGEPSCKTSLTEAGFIAQYWNEEKNRCQEELRRWQEFRNSQQRRRERQPDQTREKDTGRQLYQQDTQLTASLTELQDWKEYQAYFQRAINRCERQMEKCRQAIEAIHRKDSEAVSHTGGVQKLRNGRWLDRIESHLKWLPAEEKRLTWVKQQLPAVLLERAALMNEQPASRCIMVERSELEAKRVFHTLVEMGGRPSRPIRAVDDNQEREHADRHLDTLCHWEGEFSQFDEELREWKKFLEYQEKKETNGQTEVQPEQQQVADTTISIKLWRDYCAYQQLEVINAKQWVEFWQRQMEDCQQRENHCKLQGWAALARRYHFSGEDMKSRQKDARKKVHPIEMRLEWVEQQLSVLVRECDNASVTRKSTTRSKHRKNKVPASGRSALDPVHSSKISKGHGGETPRFRKQSKILTAHDDDQNQDHTTGLSPQLPANIAPRRSSRLLDNEKTSGSQEALNPKGDRHSTALVLRRSDRISKQRRKPTISTSNTAVNPVLTLQSDPLRRLSQSRQKGRLARQASDLTSMVKPRGISKKRDSRLQRNGKRVHN
ncbi:MAG: hypothetical protein Q9220_004160 [cf. Caloplaca sp. 1 TL-2023]